MGGMSETRLANHLEVALNDAENYKSALEQAVERLWAENRKILDERDALCSENEKMHSEVRRADAENQRLADEHTAARIVDCRMLTRFDPSQLRQSSECLNTG